MILGQVEIRCPLCRGELAEAQHRAASLRCGTCNRTYPVVLGIPDLRIFPDPYIDIEADRAKGQRLAERFHELDFAGLVDFYYSLTPAVPASQARQFKRGVLGGVTRAEATLASWGSVAAEQGPPEHSSLLDLGCGTAPLLVAARSQYVPLVGVDIAFRWLVVGKKRLAEAGLDIPLVCACAEALPFPDGVFDHVAGESVIECVRDRARLLAEVYRVLRPGGRLALSTPNRFSLGPDPHAGLWAAGFLPERWVAAYLRRRGGVPPQRHLLSAPALARLLRQTGFVRRRLALPHVTPGQRVHFRALENRLVDLYHMAKRLPLGRHLLYLIGPQLLATAEKDRTR